MLVAVAIVYAADAMKATGTVKSVDVEKSSLVVTVKREGTEKDMTFAVTKDTKIMQGETAKTLADVKAGNEVKVMYIATDEKLTATMIHIMMPMKEKKAE